MDPQALHRHCMDKNFSHPWYLAATFQPYFNGISHPSVLSLAFLFLGMVEQGPEAM